MNTEKKENNDSITKEILFNHTIPVSGGRKCSIARALIKKGSGNIYINKKKADDYFYMDKNLISIIEKPFKLLNQENIWDIFINVSGGGFNSQVGASSLAVSKLLLKLFPDCRLIFKKEGLITRNSRKKEREKVGKLKARKSYPYVKR